MVQGEPFDGHGGSHGPAGPVRFRMAPRSCASLMESKSPS
ncbi:conserved protein of unknown function [Candidatus Methylacidiphilum fumarolicum]|uniref:Uncharacterized protein n=1 Tax=Candidatus Methylacidiphilum fumarolicum TaxID=591154 RepID=A0ABM9IDN6_9BACT|nr:conserved protein of unknown function [Candidatus Methylacidiphilum fumarolicum]